MKLAEALLLRSDLQKKAASLRERIGRYASVQQGDKPHEDPEQAAQGSQRHPRLAGGLGLPRSTGRTCARKLRDGRTLTEALAHRDSLAKRHAVLQAAIDGSTKPPERYGLSEIKWVATMDVPKLQKQADDLSRQIRELNGLIQETNWRVELDEKSKTKFARRLRAKASRRRLQ